MLGLADLSPILQAMNLPEVSAPREHPRGRMVELPGRGSTYVVDTGPAAAAKAPTFFLLHSVACTGLLTWYPSLETMRRYGRVVIYDQRGHGAGIPTSRVLLEDCADDAIALADVLGVGTFIPVGFSMGSLIAQLAWYRHRDRVEGLVLCAGAATFAEAAPMRIGTSLLAGVLDGFSPAPGAPVTPAYAEQMPHPYLWALGEFRATSVGAILRTLAEIVRFDSRSWLDQIDVPTAVVIPTRDRFIPPRHQHWMAGRIPDAQTITVDAGHACCTLDHRAFVPGLSTAVESVLDRTARGGRSRRGHRPIAG